METDVNLDWVTTRANCNTKRVFHEIRDEVEQDVKTRNSFITERQRADCVGFLFEPKDGDSFAVIRNGAGIVSRITFKCDASTITVWDGDGKKSVEAKLTLTDAGECMLAIGKEELAHWQFRRRALQDLFFNFLVG